MKRKQIRHGAVDHEAPYKMRHVISLTVVC
jgi:hypothetical protein